MADLDLDGLVSAAFLRHDATHARSAQEAPGVSLTFECQRQAAYRWAGTPYSDEQPEGDEKRAAALGTWLHAGLLPQLRRVVGGRARFEVPVQVPVLDRVLGGSVDLWLHREGVTLDVKTCTDSKLSRVRQYGADRRHLAAGHVYAAGLEATVRGARPRTVAVLYLGRERGDHVLVQQPLDRELQAEALGWWEAAAEYADSGAPDQAPVGERRGPGLDLTCDSCPFRSRCWPGVPGASPQARLVLEGQVLVEDACAQLAEATARKAAAEKDAEWAKALLEGTEPAQYGAWLLKRSRSTPPGEVVDAKALELEAKAAGLPVPYKLSGGRKGSTTVAYVGPPAKGQP